MANMTIQVRLPNRKVLAIGLTAFESTVTQLKSAIWQITGVPAAQQELRTPTIDILTEHTIVSQENIYELRIWPPGEMIDLDNVIPEHVTVSLRDFYSSVVRVIQVSMSLSVYGLKQGLYNLHQEWPMDPSSLELYLYTGGIEMTDGTLVGDYGLYEGCEVSVKVLRKTVYVNTSFGLEVLASDSLLEIKRKIARYVNRPQAYQLNLPDNIFGAQLRHTSSHELTIPRPQTIPGKILQLEFIGADGWPMVRFFDHSKMIGELKRMCNYSDYFYCRGIGDVRFFVMREVELGDEETLRDCGLENHSVIKIIRQ